MKFSNKLISSYYWSLSTYNFYKKKYEKSEIYYKKFQKYQIIKSIHPAFYGTLLILLKKSIDAKKLFYKSLEINQHSNENDLYIKTYCELYINMIENQKIDISMLNKLNSYNVKPSIRRILTPPPSIL